MSTSIKVLVRVRPPLAREVTQSLVAMPAEDPKVTVLAHPDKLKDVKNTKRYRFDQCVWSHNPKDKHYMDNGAFYKTCATDLLEHLNGGFNVCLLAYGQTGLGKTHTMMGSAADPGVIPLMVRDILRQRDSLVGEKIQCEVSFTYVEIHNEKVNDLLSNSKVCRVRENPVTGPYVEECTSTVIKDYAHFDQYLAAGNTLRLTAATNMNEASSRSHAVLTIQLKQTRLSQTGSALNGGSTEELISNIKLVDLAGSERLSRTLVYNQQARLKEGSQINKSLTVLGRCINILSLGSGGVVPYRDSLLTYLLRENLSGNSRSAMVFCVSPTDFEETQQTLLNYAVQVKNMKTTARANALTFTVLPVKWDILNESGKSEQDTLREEIDTLKKELDEYRRAKHQPSDAALLIQDLERESNRQLSEIEQLRQQLASRQGELEELRKQNSSLNLEVKQVLRGQFDKELEILAESASDLVGSCKDEIDLMQLFIGKLSVG